MASPTETVRRLRVEAISEGMDRLAAQQDKVAKAMDAVARSGQTATIQTDNLSRKQLSVLKSFEAQERRANYLEAALARLTKEYRTTQNALSQGLIDPVAAEQSLARIQRQMAEVGGKMRDALRLDMQMDDQVQELERVAAAAKQAAQDFELVQKAMEATEARRSKKWVDDETILARKEERELEEELRAEVERTTQAKREQEMVERRLQQTMEQRARKEVDDETILWRKESRELEEEIRQEVEQTTQALREQELVQRTIEATEERRLKRWMEGETVLARKEDRQLEEEIRKEIEATTQARREQEMVERRLQETTARRAAKEVEDETILWRADEREIEREIREEIEATTKARREQELVERRLQETMARRERKDIEDETVLWQADERKLQAELREEIERTTEARRQQEMVERRLQETIAKREAKWIEDETILARRDQRLAQEAQREYELVERARQQAEARRESRETEGEVVLWRRDERELQDWIRAEEEAAKKLQQLEREANAVKWAVDSVNMGFEQLETQQARLKEMKDAGFLNPEQYRRGLDEADRVFSKIKRDAGQDGVAGALKLASHEWTNFQYQMIDVAQGLLTGQNPLTILYQQGGQVYQILAGAQGGVSGGLQAVASRLMAAVGPATLFIGTLVAGGIAAAYSWDRYLKSIKALEGSLYGVGRGTNATASELNRMADAAAEAGNVTSKQARDMLAAFAGTGRISKDVFHELTLAAKDYAATTRQEIPEATAELAEAFADPERGVETLNKKLGTLDYTTQQYIKRLAAQGDAHRAQRVMFDSSLVGLRKHEESLTRWGRFWEGFKESFSEGADAIGRTLEPDLETRAETARKNAEAMEALHERMEKANPAANVDKHRQRAEAARRYATELERQVREEAEKAERDSAQHQANQLSDLVGKATAGMHPLNDQMKQLQARIGVIQKLQGLAPGLINAEALAQAQRDLEILQEQARQTAEAMEGGGEIGFEAGKESRFTLLTAGLNDYARGLMEIRQRYDDLDRQARHAGEGMKEVAQAREQAIQAYDISFVAQTLRDVDPLEQELTDVERKISILRNLMATPLPNGVIIEGIENAQRAIDEAKDRAEEIREIRAAGGQRPYELRQESSFALATAGMSEYSRALSEITKKYDDEVRAAKGVKEAIDAINEARREETLAMQLERYDDLQRSLIPEDAEIEKLRDQVTLIETLKREGRPDFDTEEAQRQIDALNKKIEQTIEVKEAGGRVPFDLLKESTFNLQVSGLSSYERGLAEINKRYDEQIKLVQGNEKAIESLNKSREQELELAKRSAVQGAMGRFMPEIEGLRTLRENRKILEEGPERLRELGYSADEAEEALRRARFMLDNWKSAIELAIEDHKLEIAALNARTLEERAAIESERARTKVLRETGDELRAAVEAEMARNRVIADANKQAKDFARDARKELELTGLRGLRRALKENEMWLQEQRELLGGTRSVSGPGNVTAREIGPTKTAFATGDNSKAAVEAYVRAAAVKRGMDPDIIARGLNQESRFNIFAHAKTPKEDSWGVTQLNMMGGLGVEAKRAGIDVRNPYAWRSQVDWSLDYMKKHGHGQWYGFRDSGIRNPWAGINRNVRDVATTGSTTPGTAGGGTTPGTLPRREIDVPKVELNVDTNLNQAFSDKNKTDIYEFVQRPLEDANAALQEQVRLNQVYRETMFMTTAQIEAANEEQRMRNEFLRNEVQITPELAARIRAYAQEYGRVAQETENLKNAQAALEELGSIGKDALKGFISDLRAGKSGAEALENALNRVVDKLLDLAMDDLFNSFTKKGGGGFFSSLLSGLTGGSGLGMTPGAGGLYHDGGMVGIHGKMRYVHPAYFENAPRLHSGTLAADERAAILQTGEVVLSRDDVAAARGRGAQSQQATVVQPIVNVIGAPSQPEVRTNQDGSVDIIFERMESWQADRAARGRGDLVKAMGARQSGRALIG
ncbi:phage tail length tape measure family protein [Microvirga massiliensis]|uniref:phage tail length tape measure family protein n=1 Tax=Microvirga massiliensis TaxID=1033741 RepID=UPI00062BDE34|nr:phage tail length tape measure family protein [Microvirga massiliensis]